VNQETSDRQQKAPIPFNGIRVYGEVAFNYKTVPQSKTPQPNSRTVTVTGRLDYGIGRVVNYDAQFKRRFQCLLVVVTAKTERAVGQALPQLLVFLASLHQSRVQRNRTDASVYGVASDGYQFVFVTITHDGTVKFSRQLDIQLGDLLKVLECLRYILETAVESSPCVTSERNGEDQKGEDDLVDPMIDLDNNDYTNPPVDDDEI
jgi:hypothetical protein